MKTAVNLSEFREAFRRFDRLDNFSYEGLDALFNYLEQCEEECAYELELDVIALCCDFAEHTLEGLQREYGDYEDEKWEDMDEAIEWLQERTTVIRVDDDSVIVGAF